MSGLPDALPPTFTTKAARQLGVHPRSLYAWRDAGEVVELSRGVFRRGDAPPATYPDLLAVALRAPRGIMCCLSAAVVHDLTDELAPNVDLAMPNDCWVPRVDHPPTRVFRFAPTTFTLGLDQVEAAPGESVPVYDAARTVVDLIRLRHRLGETIAYRALNRYWDSPGARPRLLVEYAQALGALSAVRAAIDVVGAR